MKFTGQSNAASGSRVANITLGKDELKLLWSMSHEYRTKLPKLMGTQSIRSRLLDIEKKSAKIINDIWNEPPNKCSSNE